MNSEQNKNEILDVSQNNPNPQNNFPFSNNLNAKIENINYTDLIEGNKEITPTLSFGAIMSSIRILNRKLALTRVFGRTQEAIGILNNILDFIRPQTGNELLVHVENLINQTLATHYRNAATQALNNIKGFYNTYLNFFEQWTKLPETGAFVNNAFNNADNACRTALNESLSRIGFETLLLPNYVIAASLRLLLLRDAVIYRCRWIHGSNAENINCGDADYNELLLALEKYTNHCTHWYQEGLNRFQRSNFESWVSYNTYRRDMTLSVLDLVAVFPTYDPRRYPASTDVELSRIIYTDPITESIWHRPSFSRIENNLTIPPSRATVLSHMQISTAYYPEPHHQSREYWSGHWTTFTTGDGNFYGYTHGSRNIHPPTVLSDIGPWDIFMVDMTTHRRHSFGHNFSGLHRANLLGVNPQNNHIRGLLYERPISTSHFNRAHRRAFLPGESSLEPMANDYTHRLLQMMTTYHSQHNTREATFLHAWNHKSLHRENIVRHNEISQIPAVKTAFGTLTSILRGPGSTGGDLVMLISSQPVTYQFRANDTNSKNTRYFVRVRYASASNTVLGLNINFSRVDSANLKVTVPHAGLVFNPRYQDFNYATFEHSHSITTNFTLSIFSTMPAQVVIDKIELIPANLMPSLEFEKNSLDNLVEIDQISNTIEPISEAQYLEELKILWDKVNYAKQLNKTSNLLYNGDFEDLDGFGQNGWTLSNGISMNSGDSNFKGNYLTMSGARDIYGAIFPTYIYQKIHESKLKSHTRYSVSGFIGNSKDLELIVTRHGKELDEVLNVPNEYTLDKKQYAYHNCHQFKFSIDIGEVDLNTNLGIDVMLKICSPEGFSTLYNLEVVEEGPITDEALTHVNQRKLNWNEQIEQKIIETKQSYELAKQAVDELFANSEGDELHSDITLDYIKNTDCLVQAIPYVYNDWLSEIPGMNYDLFAELDTRVEQAYYLYNTLNGNLKSELQE